MKVYPKPWDKYPKLWNKYPKAWDEYPKPWDIEILWGWTTLLVGYGNFYSRVLMFYSHGLKCLLIPISYIIPYWMFVTGTKNKC